MKNKKTELPNYKILLAIFLLFAVMLPVAMSIMSLKSLNGAQIIEEIYSNPKTGDNLYVIAGLLVLAIICAVILSRVMKKKNKL